MERRNKIRKSIQSPPPPTHKYSNLQMYFKHKNVIAVLYFYTTQVIQKNQKHLLCINETNRRLLKWKNAFYLLLFY